MIGHYLSNNNENATVALCQKIWHPNKPSVLYCTSIQVFVPALTNEEMEVKLPDSVACSDLCLSTQRAYSRSRLQICLSTQHASGFHPYTPKTPIVLLLPPPYFTEMGYIYIAVEKIVFFYVTVKISKYLSTYCSKVNCSPVLSATQFRTNGCFTSVSSKKSAA